MYQPIDQQKQYTVYPMRFVISILYGLSLCVTSVLMNTVVPIGADLSELYGHSSTVINLSGLLFLLMHPIFTFPAAYVIDKFGTRYGIIIGFIFIIRCILSIIGCWLRILINNSYIFVLVGQVIAGSGRPFMVNCQAKVSANWFFASRRAAVTSIFTLITNVSLILGIAIPGFFFYSFDINDISDLNQGKKLAFNLMLTQAIFTTVCLIPNIIFQKEKPQTPPSQHLTPAKESFLVLLKSLFTNINFILLFIAFSLYFGIFNAISINLSNMINPWFYDNSAAATIWIGATPIISGFLGVMIIGFFQRKFNKFKLFIVLCMIGSSVAIFLFYPSLQSQLIWLASIDSMLNSFFLIPLVPIMLQCGCQIAFPVGQGSAVGMIIAGGNLGGFGLGIVLSIICKGQNKQQTAWGIGFILLVFFFGIVSMLFVKEQRKRQQAQRQIYQKRVSQKSTISDDYEPPVQEVDKKIQNEL